MLSAIRMADIESPAPTRLTLMLVTDRRRSRLPIVEAVQAAVAGGANVIQIREKDLPLLERLRLASDIVEAVADLAAIVVNSDVAAAIELGVGVHLPERGPDLDATTRSRLRHGALVGRSIHETDSRLTGHYDYMLFGHIFGTVSKPEQPPRGLHALQRAIAASLYPVWAIGGITAQTAAETVATGATGIAVIGAILDAADPEAASRALRAAMDGGVDHTLKENTMTQSTDSISIHLNGKETDLSGAISISSFLTGRSLVGKLVVVEINGVIVPRTDFDSRQFANGDVVEIVHFVGGG